MLKKIITIISALLITSIAHAENQLTVLNTGSKTGGYSQQTMAYFSDLAKQYDTINLVNPGNKCVAIKSLLPKIEGPVLLAWGSDFEAKERVGGCGASVDVTKTPIVRFVEKYQSLCQINKKLDITKNSGRIGYGGAALEPYERTVNAINKAFKTNHKNVGYDGWGNAKIALMNGEIDYIIVSAPGDKHVIDEGGFCQYDFSRGEKSLFKLDNQNKDLVSSNIDAWLAWNMTAEQANDLAQKLKKAHFECDTAISKWQKGCDSKGTAQQKSEFDIDQSHLIRWEESVVHNTVKKK